MWIKSKPTTAGFKSKLFETGCISFFKQLLIIQIKQKSPFSCERAFLMFEKRKSLMHRKPEIINLASVVYKHHVNSFGQMTDINIGCIGTCC